MHMKNGIIFDIDGTLWNATEAVTKGWNSALTAHGYQCITNEFVDSLMGMTRIQIAKAVLPDVDLKESLQVMAEGGTTSRKLISEGHFRLFDHEEETLRKLREKYELFILTNASPSYVEMLYKATGFAYLFTDQISFGETGLDKTDNMKVLVERHGLDQAVYVGDTEGDHQYSIRAELPFIFVEFGHGKAIDPQYSISDYDQLPALAERIFGE